MESVVAELLLVISIVMASSLVAQALFPNLDVQQTFYLKLKDAPLPASSQQLFDIINVAGEIPYNQLRVVLINTTTGQIIDRAEYNGGYIKGNIISARVQDSDGIFGTGDMLRFTGNLVAGSYEILVIKGNNVVFDGVLNIN